MSYKKNVKNWEKRKLGRIWVESSGVSGEGCIFTFILRCASEDQLQQVEVVKRLA